MSFKAKHNDYLISLSRSLFPKIGGKSLWAETDREKIVAGSLQASQWFHEGKKRLLEKAGEATHQQKSLRRMLEIDSENNEAKSYGRRVESWYENRRLLEFLSPPPPTVAPSVHTQISYETPGYVYYESESVAFQRPPLNPAQLQAGKEYELLVNGQPYYVTIKTNDKDNRKLTFNKVEQ